MMRMIHVNVKLIGDLRGLSGKKSLRVEIQEPAMIDDAIKKLIEAIDKEEFKRAILDEVTGNANPNIIILLNGREIKTLGLSTQLKDADELVFIPAAHGG
ncbi:MAG: MoaD family protein [Candidatus Bathyarchaeia archaeon]